MWPRFRPEALSTMHDSDRARARACARPSPGSRAGTRSGSGSGSKKIMMAICMLAGCRQDMHDQHKLEPLEATPFFADGRGSREPVEGTVARGLLKEDRHYWEGRFGDDGAGPPGELVDTFPMVVTREVL